ncbi:MAG: DUF6766 family protein [Actinomycetota bacterium]
MRSLRNHSLSLFFGSLFLAALVGQAFAGHAEYNAQQVAEGLASLTFWEYVSSSDFAVDVVENWQSEYLQFLLYLTATVWFLQKGSPESKELDKAGRESDKDQKVGRYATERSPRWARYGDWRTRVYSHSLALTMGLIFLASWVAQLVAGRAAYNNQQLGQLQDPVDVLGYLTAPDFWSRTLQNWQSEFLAVGSMAVFAIFLRERGSPESKPVGTPHESTGITG